MRTPLNLHILDPDGAEILVDWKRMQVGDSFFIPCINTVECEKQVRMITRFWEWEMHVKACIENDIWGVRIWRTA